MFLNKKPVDKKFLVVFVEKQDIKGDIIVGVHQFKQELCEFVYLSKDLKLHQHIALDSANFKFGKISLGENKVLDFEFLTFWFGIKEYKELWDLLLLNKKNVDSLSHLVVKLLTYFS